MTQQLLKQGLWKPLNKIKKSMEEAVLLETLIKKPHENITPNLKTGKKTKKLKKTPPLMFEDDSQGK